MQVVVRTEIEYLSAKDAKDAKFIFTYYGPLVKTCAVSFLVKLDLARKIQALKIFRQ